MYGLQGVSRPGVCLPGGCLVPGGVLSGGVSSGGQSSLGGGGGVCSWDVSQHALRQTPPCEQNDGQV